MGNSILKNLSKMLLSLEWDLFIAILSLGNFLIIYFEAPVDSP